MAKKSMVERQQKRELVNQRLAKNRRELRNLIIDSTADEDTRINAYNKFHGMARDASVIRLRNRCLSCNRPRGVYRKFGLCRICLRNAAMRGFIPGLVKASW